MSQIEFKLCPGCFKNGEDSGEREPHGFLVEDGRLISDRDYWYRQGVLDDLALAQRYGLRVDDEEIRRINSQMTDAQVKPNYVSRGFAGTLFHSAFTGKVCRPWARSTWLGWPANPDDHLSAERVFARLDSWHGSQRGDKQSIRDLRTKPVWWSLLDFSPHFVAQRGTDILEKPVIGDEDPRLEHLVTFAVIKDPDDRRCFLPDCGWEWEDPRFPFWITSIRDAFDGQEGTLRSLIEDTRSRERSWTKELGGDRAWGLRSFRQRSGRVRHVLVEYQLRKSHIGMQVVRKSLICALP